MSDVAVFEVSRLFAVDWLKFDPQSRFHTRVFIIFSDEKKITITRNEKINAHIDL